MAGSVSDVGATNAAQTAAAGFNTGDLILAGIQLYNAYESGKLAKENYEHQRDLADRQLRIAEEEQAHNATVFWPRELDMLVEYSAASPATESQSVYYRRFAGRFVAKAAKAAADANDEMIRTNPRWKTGANMHRSVVMAASTARAISVARMQADRAAFIERKTREELDFKHRQQTAALGRNLIGQAAQLYKGANERYAALGRDLDQSFMSALGALGSGAGSSAAGAGGAGGIGGLGAAGGWQGVAMAFVGNETAKGFATGQSWSIAGNAVGGWADVLSGHANTEDWMNVLTVGFYGQGKELWDSIGGGIKDAIGWGNGGSMTWADKYNRGIGRYTGMPGYYQAPG